MIIYFGLVGICENNISYAQLEINTGIGVQYQRESALNNLAMKPNIGLGFRSKDFMIGLDVEYHSYKDSVQRYIHSYGGSPSSSYWSTTSYRHNQYLAHHFLGLNTRMGGIAAESKNFKLFLGLSFNANIPVYQRYDSVYVYRNSVAGFSNGTYSSSSEYYTTNDSLLNAQTTLFSGVFTSFRFAIKQQLALQLDLSCYFSHKNKSFDAPMFEYDSAYPRIRSRLYSIPSAAIKIVYIFKTKTTTAH